VCFGMFHTAGRMNLAMGLLDSCYRLFQDMQDV
jgi:hypothetical protein